MGGLTAWQFVFRMIVLYLVVMVALRLMGKREIGQLSVFDFVISVMIAELSTVPMEDTTVPLIRSIFAIGALVVLQLVVAMAQLKSHRFRHWVDGEPSVLVEHGQIREQEMKRTRYSLHDLLTQLREKGVVDVADVEFAILETSGKLSVFPQAATRPLTPRDIQLPVQSEINPLPIIIDGVPIQKTLDALGRTELWLQNEVLKRGYGSIKQVFYATINQQGQVYLDAKDPKYDPSNRKGQEGNQS